MTLHIVQILQCEKRSVYHKKVEVNVCCKQWFDRVELYRSGRKVVENHFLVPS